MVDATDKFRKSIAPRLQRYLFIKSLLSINYVIFKNLFFFY